MVRYKHRFLWNPVPPATVLPVPVESMIRDPDFHLIRRCQSDVDAAADSAFEELFLSYRDRVFNLAARLLGNLSDAEDVTQEAFVTVYRKIREFRFSSRFYTWLYRVVYNLCIDHKRRMGSGGTVVMVGPDEREEIISTLSDPHQGPLEELAEHEYQEHAVERALRRLSEPLRVVVVLRYMEDLPYAEIAEVLECSVGTVKSRLSRAHAFLQQTLRPPLAHENG